MKKFWKDLEKKLKNSNLSKHEKIKIIKESGNAYNKLIDTEYRDYVTKQYIGSGLEIGSAAMPAGRIALGAKSFIPKIISTNLGRKFLQDVTTSAIGGAIGGAVYGTGRGIIEDENPVKTAIEDAAAGFGTGLFLGGITGKIANDARKSETTEINKMRKHWGIPFRKASGDPEKAINTLMENQRGFVPNAYDKEGIGKFDIAWGDEKSGFGHALMQRAQQKNFDVSKFVEKIPETIKDGIVTPGSEIHPDTKNIISDKQKLSISNNKMGIKRNWLVTAFPQGHKTKKRLTDWTPQSNITSENGSFSAPSISELLHNKNINEYIQKNNLAERLIPQMSQGINTVVRKTAEAFKKSKNTEPEPIKWKLELNVDKNGKPLDNNNDEGAPTGFASQMQVKRLNLTNYRNPLTGSNRVYTAEDIGEMSREEFSRHEKEIDAQMAKIGIPFKMQLGVFSGGTIYLPAYLRKDGRKIPGHFRAL